MKVTNQRRWSATTKNRGTRPYRCSSHTHTHARIEAQLKTAQDKKKCTLIPTWKFVLLTLAMARMCTEKKRSLWESSSKRELLEGYLYVLIEASDDFFPPPGDIKNFLLHIFIVCCAQSRKTTGKKCSAQPIFMSWYSNTVARSTIMLCYPLEIWATRAGNGLRWKNRWIAGEHVLWNESRECNHPVPANGVLHGKGFSGISS